MAGSELKVLSLNAHRIGRREKLVELKEKILEKSPHVVYIQEIVVNAAIKVFNSSFQVVINMEERAINGDGVGIVTLIKNGINISDFIVGAEGRTIGIKINNAQFWNIYPLSGTNNKSWRETYFRETLPNYMANWKDQTLFVNQGGDHNCIIRDIDSENNPRQHMQEGLIKQLQIFGLKDEYIRLHGNDRPVSFSRVTRLSKTRIDIIASNSDKCMEFYYVDIGPGFDHKMAVAKYDLDLIVEKEYIPRHLYVSGWAFPKELQYDEDFINEAGTICDIMENKIQCDQLIEEGEIDFTRYWSHLKKKLTWAAKQRERQIKQLEDSRKNYLNAVVKICIEKIEGGEDYWERFQNARKELCAIWQKKTERAIQKLKCIEIDDHVFDIHKLQRKKKYENQGRIRKLKIDGVLYTGTEDVLKGLEEKIKHDLSVGHTKQWDDAPTQEELFFLDKLPRLHLNVDEAEKFTGPVTEDECEYILKNEVKLDSSPGHDGVTYRLLSCLWNHRSFRWIFVNTMEWTRKNTSMGCIENVGMMKFINKKRQTEEYTGKRKLTMVSKDLNFVGKLWTNRFSKYVLEKVLPKTQYNCQKDENIIDENREIRNLVLHLRGHYDGVEKDGTLVSIDMKDAFRSTFHRWLKLIMIHIGVPELIRNWFWAMYKGLMVEIVVNKRKSGKIDVSRGVGEGMSPSMAAFVTVMIPLLVSLDEVLEGIVSVSGKMHKAVGFADDCKIALKKPEEINEVYLIIEKFEAVSGLEMHRDPAKEKCQALTFGSHRLYQHWPDWMSLKSIIKIVGILYTNDPNLTLEEVNGEKVKDAVFTALHGSHGVRGTPLQKTHHVNSNILSKLWYTGSTILLEKKLLVEIDKAMRKFIFAGQNERPVQAICYREKEDGGLGLICPLTKSKALFLKNMIKDYEEIDFNEQEQVPLYGNLADLDKILDINDRDPWTTREIYHSLLEEKLFSGDSLIPSRAEKRSRGVKWSVAWSNQGRLKQLTAEERFFAWQVPQDMVPVGARLHRPGQIKLCQQHVLDDDEEEVLCNTLETIQHALSDCGKSRRKFEVLKEIISRMLERPTTVVEILHLSFNHRNKKILITALWFSVKVMFIIYSNREQTLERMLEDMYKILFWHQQLDRGVGHKESFSRLIRMVRELRDGI